MKRDRLVMCGWIMGLLILMSCIQPGFAQVRQEQRIEGVSFRELAEWQTRYGGGISGCYPAPAPVLIPGPPPDLYGASCKPVRKKKRSGRK
ncbi:hypothetical protein [Desulfomonile tiedjei]|uniref:Uncharacterized protein n=1 Tax=Desulfomonile tiedjei (strain ATCC 49306 / DSM 6799 / DCB-1) TaxID=706587 RepID=I4CBZ7_DESTA|nr:hypothetical protein [Desulfomonile tiedjei]AFM27088.1 hypothetical protein Desti_4456 [Desulfomonile tiedjei DSM 6799]